MANNKRSRNMVEDADTLKRLQEIEDRTLLFQQELQHERDLEQDRRERERLLDQLKRDLDRDRREAQALALEVQQAETESASPPVATEQPQPRDAQGRFGAEQSPAGLTAEQAAELSLADWSRVRSQFIHPEDQGIFR